MADDVMGIMPRKSHLAVDECDTRQRLCHAIQQPPHGRIAGRGHVARVVPVGVHWLHPRNRNISIAGPACEPDANMPQ